MQVHIINNVTKEYPNMIKVMIYRKPRIYIEPESTKRVREIVDSDYIPSVTSLNRTKTTIKDLILCNDFEYFCTFTFSPDKVDRFSFSACYGKVDRFLHHQKTRSKDFKYLVVPERHKSGAWHFHALISHFNGTLRDSGHKSRTGRTVYNITSYRSGFSTAVKIDSSDAVAEYVSKYISKDFIKDFNQRRFFCSRNLTRPIKTVNNKSISLIPPLFWRHGSSFEDYDTYFIDKF